MLNELHGKFTATDLDLDYVCLVFFYELWVAEEIAE